MWCMSSQLEHIQVTLYTINAVEYTRSMARLWRGFVNSDPVTNIHLKYENVYAVKCRYIAFQIITILHTALR